MRRPLGILVVVLTGVTLAGCGGSKSDDKATATTLKKTTTTLSATATTAASPAAANLESKLLKTVPSGYKQEDDKVGDTGPSDLAKAVRDDGESDAKAVLTKDGFLAGYQRLWTKGDNELIDFVYQFSNPAGAQDYFARTIEGLDQGDAETTVTEFNVTGIPGAKGYVAHSADGDAAIVAFVRGNYTLQINLNGTDATVAVANSLATQQYNLVA